MSDKKEKKSDKMTFRVTPTMKLQLESIATEFSIKPGKLIRETMMRLVKSNA